MQIGVGRDAGVVHTHKPSFSRCFACVYIYVMCTRVHFIRVCYCAEGLHFSAFILKFCMCAFLIGIECAHCELTHCMTSFKFHEGEAAIWQGNDSCRASASLVFTGVICGCECASKIELESEQNGIHDAHLMCI